MNITKLHPLVWVFHNALKNPQEVIDFYEENGTWESWFTFGQMQAITELGDTQFQSFPTKEEWNTIYDFATYKGASDIEIETILTSITDTFYDTTRSFFEVNNTPDKDLEFSKFTIAKYIASPSARMNFHTDYKVEEYNQPGPKKHTTAIFYLNDDYIGGEITFLELDDNLQITWYDEYKPQAGDVLVFSSMHPIYHGVKTVEQGNKYMLRTYWDQIELPSDDWIQGIANYGESAWQAMEQEKKLKLRSQMIWRDFNGETFGIQYVNIDPKKPYTYWKQFNGLEFQRGLVNIYQDQIYEILDFITEKEQIAFLDVVKYCDEDCWPTTVDNEFQQNDPDISGKVLPLNDCLTNIREKIEQRISILFPNATRINNIAAIQRYKPNTNMGLHTDNALDPSVQYGLIVYLNDDYEGGEVHYPDLDITIKPKARSIIIHPASLPHEVLHIKGSNTRYILSSFVRGEEKIEVFYGE